MKTILVVDDNAVARLEVTRWLERTGYRVAMATNGREALDYLRRSDLPCLIILDLVMPEMDGWSFRHEQLKDSKLAAIPTILVTAAADAHQPARAATGFAIFPKPFDPQRLLQAVAALCR